MWAWSWASQQVCAVRWQMVTPVPEMASSSIRGHWGGSPPERWPSDRAVDIHAETASFPSFSYSALNLIPSVLQKKVPSQLLHVSRLFLQHVSKPCKERSSPTVVSDLDQMRIGSHIFTFNLRIDRFNRRTFALIVDRFGGVIPNHHADLIIEVRGQSSLTLRACKQKKLIPSFITGGHLRLIQIRPEITKFSQINTLRQLRCVSFPEHVISELAYVIYACATFEQEASQTV